MTRPRTNGSQDRHFAAALVQRAQQVAQHPQQTHYYDKDSQQNEHAFHHTQHRPELLEGHAWQNGRERLAVVGVDRPLQRKRGGPVVQSHQQGGKGSRAVIVVVAMMVVAVVAMVMAGMISVIVARVVRVIPMVMARVIGVIMFRMVIVRVVVVPVIVTLMIAVIMRVVVMA